MNILDKFKDILVEQLGVEPGDIAENSNLAAGLGADSLDIVEITMAVEQEFDVQLDDEETEKLNTVADWAELIGEKGAA